MIVPAIVHWRVVAAPEWVSGIEPGYDWCFDKNEWALRHEKSGFVPTPSGMVSRLVPLSMLPLEIYNEFRVGDGLKAVLSYMDEDADHRLAGFTLAIQALEAKIAWDYVTTYEDYVKRLPNACPPA